MIFLFELIGEVGSAAFRTAEYGVNTTVLRSTYFTYEASGDLPVFNGIYSVLKAASAIQLGLGKSAHEYMYIQHVKWSCYSAAGRGRINRVEDTSVRITPFSFKADCGT